MKKFLIVTGIVLGVLVTLAVVGFYVVSSGITGDPFAPMFADNCAVCHGDSFEGAAQGPALVGRDLVHGSSVDEIAASIANGFPDRGMPAWSGSFDEGQIKSLAIYIAEQRVGRVFTDFKTDQPLVMPTEPIETELATFRIETVATGISDMPFSIAPLPDGSLLLTEKLEGLFVVSADGQRTLIPGTPATGSSGLEIMGLDYGLGWLLDVKPHPGYAENGWIYLIHTHLCDACGAGGEGNSLIPRTMTRLLRGRIVGAEWRDEEVLWSVPADYYSSIPDIGAGGRLAFDPERYVFFSIGIKGGYFEGIQDLGTPYGKIHRICDDGRIPDDNPFAGRADAMASIWSYGHRSPQGLEFDPTTGKLWGSEMGPRGGDEVNLLEPGRNYGWPLHSKGVDYDGTPVEYWKNLGIEFDLEDIEQPVVDFTPSPAVSSFVIYDGDAFPAWRGHFLVGSLKATELYRVVIEEDMHAGTEILLEDLARIRDVEVGAGGIVYLLLEHETDSRIVRLVPGPAQLD